MDPDDLFEDEDFEPLRRAVNRGWARAMGRTLSGVGGQFGMDPATLREHESVRAVLDGVAERIVGIEDETRRRVAGYVAQAIRDELTPRELAKLIRADSSGAFGRARAMTIARTETATAINRGSTAGYRASERVEYVEVLDGEGCGWAEHDDPDEANGKVVTLDEADEQPISHPNCVRAFSPVVRLD